MIGAVVGILLAVGLAQPRFNYWRFEANEFVHYVQPWGRDQSIPRQGSTVVREIPDVLELILSFGGGTLAVKREGQIVARIEHVPFLGRRMKGLERLEERRMETERLEEQRDEALRLEDSVSGRLRGDDE